jgi:glycosyltransferase involved in cell wall biosynthesis
VVLSRTRGLWAPAGLRDGENLMLVPPADPRELAHSVRLLLDDQPRADAIGRAARESVLADATVEGYAERLLEVCRLALATN